MLAPSLKLGLALGHKAITPPFVQVRKPSAMPDGNAPATGFHIDFDPAALRAKYRAERDKRLRPDGNDQYVKIGDAMPELLQDPYSDPDFVRDPINDVMDVVIIGGGFGGLLAGARLRQAGVKDIRIIDKGADFGGTWYWNRYPGAACDTEAYVYLPLLEETGTVPTEKYVSGPEILAHSQAIARQFGLYKNACLQTEVIDTRWDEAATRWIVRTNRGDTMQARFIVVAGGPLHRPKLPRIPGIETFKGHHFHTSRWDYAYTGGTIHGGLTGLADKRVGIIGTGATAVQCIPHLAASAQQLFVFQRTPSSIDVRANRPTDPHWVQSLQPGWHQKRMDNFNSLTSGGMEEEDLVGDGWTDIVRTLLLAREANPNATASPEEIAELVQLADFAKMEQVRARVDAIVKDPVTAEALKPYYNQFCKRPCFHDAYLDAFNRPGVRLVDTQGRGVDRITETAVIANGESYALDCLIFATGFELGVEYSRSTTYDIHGVDGTTLKVKYADGVRTLHGLHNHNFPNCFIMAITQSGFSFNFTHMLNEQSKHIAHIVRYCAEHGHVRAEVTREAEADWVETIKTLAVGRLAFLSECTPGYYNNEGQPDRLQLQNSAYGLGPVAFIKVLEDWRARGGLPGIHVQ
jgi:cyclohexanone monooxygenase